MLTDASSPLVHYPSYELTALIHKKQHTHSLLPVCSAVSPAWSLHVGVNVNTLRSAAPALCLLEHFHGNNQPLLFTRDAARVL